jgi:hypothetical protein
LIFILFFEAFVVVKKNRLCAYSLPFSDLRQKGGGNPATFQPKGLRQYAGGKFAHELTLLKPIAIGQLATHRCIQHLPQGCQKKHPKRMKIMPHKYAKTENQEVTQIFRFIYKFTHI